MEKGIVIALFITIILVGSVFGVKAIDTIFADDPDHQGSGKSLMVPPYPYERTEYLECPVEIIHFAYLPADLSELDDFERDAVMLAQVIHGEANGLPVYDKSMVAWCVLNRLDMGLWGSDIYSVVSSPHQFNWKNSFPVSAENYKIATDVLTRWYCESNGWFYSENSSGRTLPKTFVNFGGNGKTNTFKDRNGNVYTRYLRDPYE